MDLVLNQNVAINNPELKAVTTEIRKAGMNVIGNTYKIAALIARVESDELYAEDGFTDVFDYVKQCFGLEKTSAYNLIKVGREFIHEIESGKTTKFETLLTHSRRDFSISQVYKMLPLGIEKAKELTADGVIDVDMSCRQIEKIVKDNTEPTSARGKTKTEPEPVEDEEPDDTPAVLIVEWDDLPELAQAFFNDEYDLEGIEHIEVVGFNK